LETYSEVKITIVPKFIFYKNNVKFYFPPSIKLLTPFSVHENELQIPSVTCASKKKHIIFCYSDERLKYYLRNYYAERNYTLTYT